MDQELGPLTLPPQNCFSFSLSFQDPQGKATQIPRCSGWEVSCLAEVDFAYLGSKLRPSLPGAWLGCLATGLRCQQSAELTEGSTPHHPHSPKVLLFFPWRMKTEGFSCYQHTSPEATERPNFPQSWLSALLTLQNLPQLEFILLSSLKVGIICFIHFCLFSTIGL